jgi:hypothetical protein
MYAIKIVIKYAKIWKYDGKGGENLCYKFS